MVHFKILDFPMPPSANNLYANMLGRGRFKTAALRGYEKEVSIWALQHRYLLESAREQVSKLEPGEALSLERVFYFPYASILTKDGRPRRNDTSNRIKALDDVLATILGIDDSIFWSGSESKGVCRHRSLGEYVDITFQSINIRFSK